MSLKVATANRLIDGRVVFLGEQSRWQERIADAVAAEGAEADALMKTAEYHVATAVVVGAYLIDVTTGPEGLTPSALKERIRAFGPTVM